MATIFDAISCRLISVEKIKISKSTLTTFLIRKKAVNNAVNPILMTKAATQKAKQLKAGFVKLSTSSMADSML